MLKTKDVRRVIFKCPGMVFFRRCFFVRSIEKHDEFLCVDHGAIFHRRTFIPIKGSVIRYVYKL